jgi:hypothetical protein
MSRILGVLIPVFVLSATACVAQTESKTFPTTGEIQLVVTQAERAFDQYKTSVDREAELPSAKKDSSAVEKDREIIEMASKVIVGLKKKPEVFYSLGGLLLLTTLDDASRNAALCSGTGMSDVGDILVSNSGAANSVATGYRILATTQQCMDVSAQLYTVSESVSALLGRAMEAQNELNDKAMDTLNKCKEVMKAAAAVK